MNTQMAKVNKKELEACLNCPICNKPFDQATTINECLHTFCKKCIDEKLREENPKTCPVCNVVIGETPPKLLRGIFWLVRSRGGKPLPHFYDKTLESLKNKILSAMQKNEMMKTKTFAATQNSNSNAVHGSEHNPEQSHVEKCVPESSENLANTSCDILKKGKGKVKCSQLLKKKKVDIPKVLNTPQDETVNVEDNNKIATRNVPIWFTLMASNNQDVNACLPQIPSKYLMVKDRNLPVSFIKKYIAMKLDLANETEIEIFLRDQPLDSSQPLHSLIEMWVEAAPASERIDALVGSSAEDFVMILTYGRKI